jgi:hypothetical protein|tara:strand:+ start:44 stop:178 length:135 start_codon:yes stop_codon:yes gene_type:complete
VPYRFKLWVVKKYLIDKNPYTRTRSDKKKIEIKKLISRNPLFDA